MGIRVAGCALALCLGVMGCADPGAIGAGTEAAGGVTSTDPHRQAERPTVFTAPPVSPRLEFPSDPLWQSYWMVLDNPQRGRFGDGPLVDGWVSPQPGEEIADIGAGGGYFSFRYAPIVGESGHVYAADIDWLSVRSIAWEAKARGALNLSAVHLPHGQLGLTPQSVDALLLIDTGILLDCDAGRRAGYVRQITEAVRPGGRVMYTDLTDLMTVPSPETFTCQPLSGDQVSELLSAGFSVERRLDQPGRDGPTKVSLLLRRRGS